MAKYKVGDRVRVRSDLQDGLCYVKNTTHFLFVTSNMAKLAGQVVTITNVNVDEETYRVFESECTWSDAMFEYYAERKEDKMTNIKSYKVLNDVAMIVEFADGDVQKAVCKNGDVFDFTRGLELCVVKHTLGGDDKYKALIRSALRDIKAIDKETEKQKEEAELIARKKAKAARRKAQKLARKREERIEEQKEAYLRAMRESKKLINNIG